MKFLLPSSDMMLAHREWNFKNRLLKTQLKEGKSATIVDKCDFFRSCRSLFTTEVIYVDIYISLSLSKHWS
jgi:hypothetical protein